MQERHLQGHAALVTGGTQGVGQAIAIALARAGADLVVHGHRHDESAIATVNLCRDQKVACHLVVSDLSEQPATAAHHLWQTARNHLPTLDLLVSNAGTYRDRPFLEMDLATFDYTMKLNVYAHYFLVQAAAQDWVTSRTPGRVLLTGSINGRLAEPDHSAYDTSKGAIEMMVKSLCVTLAPLHIRVNGLAPGLVQTPLTIPALSQGELLKWMQWHTPNGEVPPADVCGEAAAFLLSDAARHIHGQMLLVDGGMSAWQQPEPMPAD